MLTETTPLMDTNSESEYYTYTCALKDGAREHKVREAAAHSSRSSLGASLRDLLDRSLSHSGSHCSVRDLGGTATVAEQIFNLFNNIVGAGVLALPCGVAAFADAPSAIVPSSIHIVIMGVIFAYFFLILGKACMMTLAATYRETWEATIGSRGGTVVANVNMLLPAFETLLLSMILADTFKSLSETVGLYLPRTLSLLLITLVALLPLCLLKNLQVLSQFSLMGMVSMFLTMIGMGVRYFDGTYDPLQNGKYLVDVPDELKPKFGSVGARGAWNANVLVFLCMTFEAFLAHYNAPRFYMELENPTVARFSAVVNYSFGLSSLTYMLVTAFGFLSFGANCDGYILNNYSTNDYLATFCRVAVALKILLTYPLTFIGFRDGVLDVFQVPMSKQTSTALNALTVVLLSMITTLAIFFTDLGTVIVVGSGSLVPFVVFVFPAMMYSAAIRNEILEPTVGQLLELKLVFLLMCVGVIMGAVGVWLAVTGKMP